MCVLYTFPLLFQDFAANDAAQRGKRSANFFFCLLSLCVAHLLGASFFLLSLGTLQAHFFVLPAQSKEMDGSLFLGRYEGGTKGFSFAKKARKNLGKSLFSPLPQIQIDCRCNSLFPLGGKRCLRPPPFFPNKLRL